MISPGAGAGGSGVFVGAATTIAVGVAVGALGVDVAGGLVATVCTWLAGGTGIVAATDTERKIDGEAVTTLAAIHPVRPLGKRMLYQELSVFRPITTNESFCCADDKTSKLVPGPERMLALAELISTSGWGVEVGRGVAVGRRVAVGVLVGSAVLVGTGVAVAVEAGVAVSVGTGVFDGVAVT